MSSEFSIRREQYRRVIEENEAPSKCFTCGQPSTHVTTGITPAGYHAWQCAAHAPATPAPLWGSDPGWQTGYETIEQARGRYRAAGRAAVTPTVSDLAAATDSIESEGTGNEPTSMDKVFADIRAERAYQDAKWGTVEQNPHSSWQWSQILHEEFKEAEHEADTFGPNWRRELVQVAAVAVAAVEQYDSQRGCDKCGNDPMDDEMPELDPDGREWGWDGGDSPSSEFYEPGGIPATTDNDMPDNGGPFWLGEAGDPVDDFADANWRRKSGLMGDREGL